MHRKDTPLQNKNWFNLKHLAFHAFRSPMQDLSVYTKQFVKYTIEIHKL